MTRCLYDEHVADWKEVVRKRNETIKTLQQRIDSLEGELAATRQVADGVGAAKSQSPIERPNMLKAIYGMAVRGYSYDPAGKRSGTIPEIVSDLALEGLTLSEDTVRRYLKEGKESLANWKANT